MPCEDARVSQTEFVSSAAVTYLHGLSSCGNVFEALLKRLLSFDCSALLAI